MFDIGFGELLLIAVVALIVLGPERLPKAARFAGLWVRRARAQWYSVKSELEREMAAEELKRSLQETREAARDLGKEAGDAARRLEEEVREAEAQARREVESMRRESLSGLVPEEEAAAEEEASQPTEPRQPDLLAHDADGDPKPAEEGGDGERR